MKQSPTSNWFSLSDLAGLALPGLPQCKRALHTLAVSEGWIDRTDAAGNHLARRRSHRGGGTEYHASVLPLPAQEALVARRKNASPAPIAANDTSSGETELWEWFERQSDAIKAKAHRRMTIIMEVEALFDRGWGKTEATKVTARKHGVSASSIAGWRTQLGSAPRHGWLPRLAPQYKGGGKEAEIDPELWQILISDYGRDAKPAFAACYNRLVEEIARPRGIALPDKRTLKRRADKEISAREKARKREGKESFRRVVPPQIRSVADLHAMEAVNIDGHTFDVFVRTEDGRIIRPILVGIQDLYSRKLLAWRIAETESAQLARLVFADLFRNWGIPGHALLDNGRGFASKSLTGGAKTRFRFKVKEYEQTGVLTALAIKTHWTLPYRGSSKPIERAWRDLCEYVAKHPAMAGAYTGNKPTAKPDSYRERAIPMEEFKAHVDREIAAHNARQGRATETAKGRSFDATFAESYATSSVVCATASQLRIALLEATERRCHREHGAVTIDGNRYHCPQLVELRGKKVIVRYNPDNLHSDVHIYDLKGHYLFAAPVQAAVGFFDKAAAKSRQKAEAAERKQERELEKTRGRLNAARLAELFSGHAEPAPAPRPGAARIARVGGHVAAALKPVRQDVSEPVETPFIGQFVAGVTRLRSVE